MAPRMEKVSQIETGRRAGPILSDISSLLSWHWQARLAPMENSQVPSSSQIICTQKKKKKSLLTKTAHEGLKRGTSQSIFFFFFRFLTSFLCLSGGLHSASVCHLDQCWVPLEPGFGFPDDPRSRLGSSPQGGRGLLGGLRRQVSACSCANCGQERLQASLEVTRPRLCQWLWACWRAWNWRWKGGKR